MNQKQKEFLAKYIEEHSFLGEKEPEWPQPVCLHTFQIEPLFEELMKLA